MQQTPVTQGHPVSPAAAPLTYITDATPGFGRRRRGRGFSYHDATKRPLPPAALARVRALAIPPAWTDVWISPDPTGHLQATGHDERGRKQYLYHPAWAAARAAQKFRDLPAFGAALGRLRRRMARDLAGTAGERAFTLAALVCLIDRAWLRVGGEAYRRENGTYGATTLLARHVRLSQGVVRLRFRGKGGRRVSHTLRDRRLHRVLQEIGDLPGRRLFTCIGPDGAPRPVTSQEVNAYIAEATALDGATAKTFRTWGGTLAAWEAARGATGPLTVKALAGAAAERLANTPAICRTSYIHPAVLALAELAPEARAARLSALPCDGDGALRVEERRLLHFLAATA